MTTPVKQGKILNIDPAELSLQGELFYAAAVAIRIHAETHACPICERNVAVLMKTLKTWVEQQSPTGEYPKDPFAAFDKES